MKELYPESMKLLVIEVMEKLFKDKKEEYEELKYVLKPSQLKSTIRGIIKFECVDIIKNEIKNNFDNSLNKIYKSITPVVIEEVKLKLKTIDVSQVLRDDFDKKLSENFEDVILQSLKFVDREFSKRISKRMGQMINLKTSTMIEIKQEVNSLPCEKDEDYLEKLNDFEGDEKYLEWFDKLKRG